MRTVEAPASRALDAAVAIAMGFTVWMPNTRPDGWAVWDGSPVDDLYISSADRPVRRWLPRYSAPGRADYHRAALLDCLLWLMRRPSVLILAEAGDTTLDGPNIWRTMDLDTADFAAFALAISRAVVLVSGAEEIDGL